MSSFSIENFVNRATELERVRVIVNGMSSGAPFSPAERVIHFVGPSGIGKSSLLKKIHSTFESNPRCISLLVKMNKQSRPIGNSSEHLINEVQRELISHLMNKAKKDHSLIASAKNVSELGRAITISLPESVLLLLLDEVNTPSKEELDGIEDHLLFPLLHGIPRFILVTAGRTHPMLTDFTLRPSSTNTFHLKPFDKETTAEQLEKLKPSSKQLAGKLHELGGGIPGNTAKLADFVSGEPPNIPNELQAVQALRTDPKNQIEERFHPVIEAICILSDFEPDDTLPLLKSHPALGREWPITKLSDVLTDLKKVQVGPGALMNWDRKKKGFVLDESIRRIFEQELRLRDPELWRKLHCTAYKMYKDWGEEFDSQLFRDKSAYHQQRLREYGMDCTGFDEEG